jgi:hypothetical protein
MPHVTAIEQLEDVQNPVATYRSQVCAAGAGKGLTANQTTLAALTLCNVSTAAALRPWRREQPRRRHHRQESPK